MITMDQLIMKLKMKMLYWQHYWTLERLGIYVKTREATVLVSYSFLLMELVCPMFKANLLESVAIFGLIVCLVSLLLLICN